MGAMLVLLAACNDDVGLNKVIESDGLRHKVLEVSPLSLDYGIILDNTPVTDVVTLTSTGDDAVTVSDLRVSNASAFSVAALGDATLAPGDSADVVVTYIPTTHRDVGTLTVVSDADVPEQVVSLTGAGYYPALTVDPASILLLSEWGETVSQDVRITSVGTADLRVSDYLVDGPFVLDHDALPATLAPGDATTVTVAYTPASPDAEDVTGTLWITSNAPSSPTPVPILGQVGVPCIGLGEAWDDGDLRGVTTAFGSFAIHNDRPDVTICVDDWYLWLSDDSQDMGVGDMDGDSGGAFPSGSILIGAEDQETFDYSAWNDGAWWCVELYQTTLPNIAYRYTGARVPEPLLGFMRDGDQDAVWAWEEEHPVMAVGRDTNVVDVPTAGGAVDVALRVWNMGDYPGVVEVRETVPTGWSAEAVDPPADRVETNSDGSTVLVWDRTIDEREIGLDVYEPTLYDEQVVGYTLIAPSCTNRTYLTPAEGRWYDRNGVARVSTAIPMTVRCVE